MVLSWDQIISLLGAFLILLAYAVESLRPGQMNRWTFQILNGLGALGLLISAIVNVQYGFIVLEACWVGVSLVAMFKLARGGNSAPKS